MMPEVRLVEGKNQIGTLFVLKWDEITFRICLRYLEAIWSGPTAIRSLEKLLLL